MQRILTIAAAFLFLMGCGTDGQGTSDRHDEIKAILTEGNWRFDTQQMEAELPVKDLTPAETSIARASFERLTGAILTFNADSTMVIQIPGGQFVQGNWMLQPDGSGIVLQPRGSRVKFQPIGEVSEDRIVLEAARDSGHNFRRILVSVD